MGVSIIRERVFDWAAVALFMLNLTCLAILRPPMDEEGAFQQPVLAVQIAIMVLTALLLLGSQWPKISLLGLKVFGMGLLLDGLGLLFFNVDYGLYLDTVGTVLVGVMLGPSVSALTALSSQAVLLIFFPSAIPFYMINMVVGWGAGLLSRMGGFRTVFRAVLTGLLLGTIAGIVAVPLMSLGLGTDPTMLRQDPMKLLSKVFGIFVGGLAGEEATSDPLDKAVVCLIVALIIPFVIKIVKWDQ